MANTVCTDRMIILINFNEIKLETHFSIIPVTFQVLSNVWLVATVLNDVETEHFHHPREF